MHRFYDPSALTGAGLQSLVQLDEDQSHHARRVLRLDTGDCVEIFDGMGRAAKAEIQDYQNKQARLRLLELRDYQPPRPRLFVATALPKGSRGDDMVNQLSQAGADVLIPLRSKRSVTDMSDHRQRRFERIIIESAKQCERMRLLEVAELMDLRAVLRQDVTLRLLAQPRNETVDSSGIRLRIEQAQSIMLLIGPEGGWAQEELEAADAAGCVSWCLGPNILRIETAAVVATGIIRYLAFNPAPTV